jgi:hypothetical protein
LSLCASNDKSSDRCLSLLFERSENYSLYPYCSSESENFCVRFDTSGREFSASTPRTIRATTVAHFTVRAEARTNAQVSILALNSSRDGAPRILSNGNNGDRCLPLLFERSENYSLYPYCSSESENYCVSFSINGSEFSDSNPRTIKLAAESLPRPVSAGFSALCASNDKGDERGTYVLIQYKYLTNARNLV